MKSIWLATVSLGSLLCAPSAWAQTAHTVPSDTVEEVVVTGSRIQRPDYDSPSPVMTTSAEQMRSSGEVNVESIMSQMPQFSGNARASGPQGQAGGGGRATLNLRGLGAVRTLVLLDGRRLPSSGADGIVDANILPISVVQNVQVVTGGASAVYGSEAMAGVVNFVTRRNVSGVELDLQYGDTFQRDRSQLEASATLGGNFAEGRGNAVLVASYFDRAPLWGRDRKEYFLQGLVSSFIPQFTYVPSGTNLPTQAAVDTVFANYGTPSVGRTLALGFNDDGTLFAQTGAVNYRGPRAGLDGEPWIVNGNVAKATVTDGFAVVPQERHSVFSRVTYELTPQVSLYGQVLYVDSLTKTRGGAGITQFQNPLVPITNPFIPQDLRAILAQRPNPTAPVQINGRFAGPMGLRNFEIDLETTQFVGGVRGSLPISDWTFDIYGSRDRTSRVELYKKSVLHSRVQQLLSAPDGGASICAGGYNPFGLAHGLSVSQACQDYMSVTALTVTDLGQDVVEGAVQGSLFKLPAGAAKVALVATHRRSTYEFTPDQALASGDVAAVPRTPPGAGDTRVSEFGGELYVPLLADLPFVQKLDVTAGARVSKYSETGTLWSYKLDTTWQPVTGVMFRGGYQRATRAPNINELFSAAVGGQAAVLTPPSAGEPCDVRTAARTGANGAKVRELCIATGIPAVLVDTYTYGTTSVPTVTQGNRDLDAEYSTSLTAGVVLKSKFDNPLLSTLSIAVDYYSIEIKDVISTIAGGTVLTKCYNLDGSNPSYAPDNPYCALVRRDAGGTVSMVNTTFLNLGGLKTDGVDAQLDWVVDLTQLGEGAVPGRIRLNTAVSYLMSSKTKIFAESPYQDFAGTSNLWRWRALTSLGYDVGPFAATLRWQYYPAVDDITRVTRPLSPSPETKSFNQFDLSASYDVTEAVEVRAGIVNLFDASARMVSGQAGSYTYDIIGRSFYVGARAKF